MSRIPTPMRITILPSGVLIDPDNDTVLDRSETQESRRERRIAPSGVEYVVERDVKEEMSRAAATLGSAVPIEARRRGGAKGGLSRSEAKLAAVARNIALSDGRTPSTPDGIARLPLRKALESVFGKPLPKQGPIAKLVHKMSSARVLRKTWPAVEQDIPQERRREIAGLVDALADTLDRMRNAEPDDVEYEFPSDP